MRASSASPQICIPPSSIVIGDSFSDALTAVNQIRFERCVETFRARAFIRRSTSQVVWLRAQLASKRRTGMQYISLASFCERTGLREQEVKAYEEQGMIRGTTKGKNQFYSVREAYRI